MECVSGFEIFGFFVSNHGVILFGFAVLPILLGYLGYRLIFKLSRRLSICLGVLLCIVGMSLHETPFIVVKFLTLVVLFPIVGFVPKVIGSLSLDDGTAGKEQKDKILRMLQEGKITTEESVELINAVGKSSAVETQGFNKIDIGILLGSFAVLLGFFLPWAYAGQLGGLFGDIDVLKVGIYQSGYHTGTLGWSIFSIAIVQVLLTFIPAKNFHARLTVLQIFIAILGFVVCLSVFGKVPLTTIKIGPPMILIGFMIQAVFSATKFKEIAK